VLEEETEYSYASVKIVDVEMTQKPIGKNTANTPFWRSNKLVRNQKFDSQLELSPLVEPLTPFKPKNEPKSPKTNQHNEARLLKARMDLFFLRSELRKQKNLNSDLYSL